MAAQGWPPVRGRVLIEGVVAVPLEVGAFRRDEYAGLLTPSRWRRPCLAPRDEETLFGLTCRAHLAAE